MKQKIKIKREITDALGCIGAFIFFFLCIYVFAIIFHS